MLCASDCTVRTAQSVLYGQYCAASSVQSVMCTQCTELEGCTPRKGGSSDANESLIADFLFLVSFYFSVSGY